MMKELREIIKFADDIVSAKNPRYRNNQSGQKTQKIYDQITENNTYSLSYTQQCAFPHLWKPRSVNAGEKETTGNISSVLESKMHKENISTNPLHKTSDLKKRILLAYRQRELEASIAQALAQSLTTAGYELFMGTRQSICQGNTWTQQLEIEYQQCDCLVFLLSKESLISELVTEGLKRAIAIRQTRQTQKPFIIGIRVNLSSNTLVSHELQNYLDQIQQWEWRSQNDTTAIIEATLHQLLQLENQSHKKSIFPPLNHQWLNTQKPLKKTLFYTPNNLPLPSTKPELPNTNLSSTHFYVERLPYEQQCYETIVKPGALIRICASRQMGKTSLLNRILGYAAQQNYHTVLLDFQQADKSILTNLDKLVRWFCTSLALQLNLPLNLDDYWDDDIGTKASSTVYLQNYLLKQIEKPIVIALEEVSAIFEEIAITQDFFTLLRCWHEKAKLNPLWAKIRLVMVHLTNAYIPLTINQSPLNVGLGINLPPFSLKEVETLLRHYQLNLTAQEIRQLMQLLAGHPYLIRLSLYYLSQGQITVTKLLETAATDTGIYSDHLHRLLWNLQQHQSLVNAFKRVLLSPSPVQLDRQQGSKLESLGLVTLNNEQYTLSCNLYRLYFSDRLIK